MEITGAIFDMDGTLLDSMHIWENVGADILRALDITPRDDLREQLRPLSLMQAAEYLIAEYGVQCTVAQIVEIVNGNLEYQYREVVLPKPGATELLEKLRAKGIPMCVATATARHLALAALTRTGLLPYFKGVFTCAEVGKGKDSPAIFLRALDCLGTEKKTTLVFEDALFAIETAKKAGFPVVAIYDASAAAQQEEIRALSDLYARDYECMADMLLLGEETARSSKEI
ncbi:MAG: hypothetical protein ABT01_04560 [Clostridium sp. SCN 57-10]|nr:MAG: hypothetical protein ABT01_04560 [Clostridium sp. SCN 57-10]